MKNFLFFLHLILIIGYMLLGLFFSFWFVVLITALHRLHYKIFDGCILSKFQRKVKGLAEDMTFFQDLFQRFFGRSISREKVKLIDYSVAGSSLFLAFVLTYLI